jgi:hypothetical protein
VLSYPFDFSMFSLDGTILRIQSLTPSDRCLYNALNDRIRNLLLQYDYSKSVDPLQPFAAHLSSLLVRDHPQTADIVVTADDESFPLHKFVLSARSPYFRRKLAASPGVTSWKLPNTIPPQAFSACIKYLYLGEAPRDLRSGPGSGFTEADVLAGIDRIGKHLELRSLLDTILESGDRRLARQRRTDEVAKGREQMETWFRENVLKHKFVVETERVGDVKWDRNNGIFADVLLRADEDEPEDYTLPNGDDADDQHSDGKEPTCNIPVGPLSQSSEPSQRPRRVQKSVIYPVHRAMLLRSEFFLAMFSGGFREAQITDYLHVISVDCSPEILEIVLTYLYTEKADFGLDMAVDVLFAADLLFIERLKTKAAVVISTLGNGTMASPQSDQTPVKAVQSESTESELASREKATEDHTHETEEPLDIYEIIRAAWLTRVQRLEEFAARYLAYRLESHVDSEDFEQLVVESANRIRKRQETDSIELIDDIRYYLSERFRLRFEDAGIDEMMEDEANQIAEAPKDTVNISVVDPSTTDTNPPNWGSATATSSRSKTPEDEGVDMSTDGAHSKQELQRDSAAEPENTGPVIRTLDGQIAGDEFSRDAMDYQILLNKLDRLLEKLNLDA